MNQNLQISQLTERDKIKALRLELEAKKSKIEAELSKLKEVALTYAPELLSNVPRLKWDYQPGIHKLSEDYFKLDTANLRAVYKSYKSPATREKWLNRYGLRVEKTVSYSWKPLNKGGKD